MINAKLKMQNEQADSGFRVATSVLPKALEHFEDQPAGMLRLGEA
ncbi:MAG: hypothetical protein SFV81_10355 [Pirellulaceae bacterium]|nr:hypothetical protein [Pirellulaceae bacterium]